MSSEASEPYPANPLPPRVPAYAPRPPAPRGSGVLGCLFAISMLFNVVAFVVVIVGCIGATTALSAGGELGTGTGVVEHLHSGNTSASDKIAIVHLDGVIMEGLLEFVHKQIERAGADKSVKAVVFRINSPGGSITASDDLYHRVVELRDGNPDKKITAKPLVVSMGALAASGGYYVAMPGQSLFAERTTMTGSIGVYASFPTIKDLSEKWGFGLNTIKQGKIKDSGSMFKDMTDEEKQVWQDLVDTAYQQFVGVVETGRPNLKGKMLDPLTIQPVLAGPPVKDKPRPGNYKRYRADGGIFTADKALEFGLIDHVGFVDDAVKEAKKLAGIGEDYKAVDYEKPKTLFALLTARSPAPGLLEPGALGHGLIPRLWYLSAGCQLSGMLAAMQAE